MAKAPLQPVLEVPDEAALSVSRLGFAEVAVSDLKLRANLGRPQQFSQSTSPNRRLRALFQRAHVKISPRDLPCCDACACAG